MPNSDGLKQIVPLNVRINVHLSERTRRELQHIREGIAVALAQAGGDSNREKFIPGLQAYRDAVDLVLSIEPPRSASAAAKQTRPKQRTG